MALNEQEEFELLSLEREKSQFASTPGGAAVGNPAAARGFTPRVTVGELPSTGVADILTAGGIGAALGAAAPEILTGAGAVAGTFPVTAPMAGPLRELGNMSRGWGRATNALFGGVGGAVGETAGKLAEALDAGPVVAEGARFAGGMAAPGAGNAALWGLKKYVSTPALSFVSKIRKEALRKLLGKIEGSPDLMTDKEKQLFTGLTAELRGGPKTDAQLERVFDALDAGATVARRTASQEADRILAQSEQAAKEEMTNVMRGDVAKRRAALPRLQGIGADAIEAAQAKRLAIAPDRELSEIGTDLRGVIVKRNEAAIAQRRAQFAADEKERDAIVQAKEASGEYLEALPEYKTLMQSLKDKLLANKKARMGTGTRPVSDPGTEAGYQRILDAASSKRVMVSEAEAAEATEKGLRVIKGTNPQTGEPAFYREFATSFEALDDVRRKLGTVFSKQPAEGYEAIGADIARNYYAQISNIQKKFAGEPQERLLQRYAESTEGMEMFRSKTGKAATAVDRYNDEEFVTEAGKLPRRYLANPEGIKALTELTGSKQLVVDSAKEYAVNSLRGMSEKQVRSWMTANRELMRAVPEVHWEVSRYADSLARGERIAKNTQRGGEIVRGTIGDKIRTAESTAARTRAVGEREAGAVFAEGEQRALELIGNKFPADRVRQLIESGNPQQWDAVAPAIRADQQSRGALADAIRQVVADRAEKSTAGLSQFFERNIRPAVERSGLMSQQQAMEIAARLRTIENLKVPEEQKISIAKRLMMQSVGSYSATVAARLATSGFDAMTGANEVPQ